MSDIAVRVEGLGKCYQIGQNKSGDFRQSFGSWINNLRGRSNGQLAESKEFWALTDINFEIKKGEAVGIIGRNGAGKSTLLKILSRITEPTKGRFEINGRVSSLLEVGTGFHPELSGRENIYLNGTILGMKRREIKAKFDEIIAFSGVEKFIDTPVKHYSSGMKVRLAFSVAAHLEPEILIIDEVLAVGDAEFQKKCLGKMDEVSRNEGRTVVFVSHNMGAMEALCTSSMLLSQGKLTSLGDTSTIIEKYLNHDVIPSNIIDFLTTSDPSIQVTDIKINGSTANNVNLKPNECKLLLSFKFLAKERVKLSIYFYLHDMFGKQIGIYSPGHLYSEKNIKNFEIGEHLIIGEALLPKLHSGKYYLTLGLALPGVIGYAHCSNAITLVSHGHPANTGLVFQQNINGYFLIGGKVETA